MVPLVHLYDTLSLIIKIYELSNYDNFEEFADNILNKFSAEFLALWFLANLQTGKTLALKPTDSGFIYEKNLLQTNFSDVDFIEPIDDSFLSAVSAMSKKLWTVDGEDPTYKPKLTRTNYR